MNFYKKHYATIKSISLLLSAIAYLHHYLDVKFSAMEDRFDIIEWRLTKLETIMVMNGMMYPHTMEASEEYLFDFLEDDA